MIYPISIGNKQKQLPQDNGSSQNGGILTLNVVQVLGAYQKKDMRITQLVVQNSLGGC